MKREKKKKSLSPFAPENLVVPSRVSPLILRIQAESGAVDSRTDCWEVLVRTTVQFFFKHEFAPVFREEISPVWYHRYVLIICQVQHVHTCTHMSVVPYE